MPPRVIISDASKQTSFETLRIFTTSIPHQRGARAHCESIFEPGAFLALPEGRGARDFYQLPSRGGRHKDLQNSLTGPGAAARRHAVENVDAARVGMKG